MNPWDEAVVSDADGTPVTPRLVLHAYRQRCFPMADSRRGRIRWYRPPVRAVITWDAYKVPESLAKVMKRQPYRITIDGDTSTSDSLIIMASGASGFNASARGLKLFQAALDNILAETAAAIAADGEGATRFFRILVTGAKTSAEADRVARRIANSPLVKTAFHAADPNWGRVMAAAGSAGVPLDPGRVSVRFESSKNTVEIVRAGMLSPAYREAQAAKILSGTGFTVRVNLGRGKAERAILTCDFSADYVKINAEYRT